MRKRIQLLLLCVISGVSVCGSEPTIEETTQLAASLDELVQQRPAFHPEHFGKGFRFYAATPFELSRIVPIVGQMLKIDEAELRDLLAEDRQPLSRVVYARLLGAKRNIPWKPLLINGEDLLLALRSEGVSLAKIHDVLDNLDTELSFASLDSPVIPEQHHRPRGR